MLVRADASSAIGSGHVMRCLALAKAWQNVGGSVTWLMAESIPALDERLHREGIALKKLHVPVGSNADARLCASEALETGSDWVIVDGYRFDPDYIRAIQLLGLSVLFLDDDGRFASYPADVVLNQNISAIASMYTRKSGTTRLLLGSEFVLLRPEFLAACRDREIPSVAEKVLVTMGGSDSENVTRKVLGALSRLNEQLEVKVVIGSGNPRADELLIFSKQMRRRVDLEYSPENIAPIMRWADVALSAAGSTSWELAYMGLPAIVISLSPDQQVIAAGLAEREIAVSLGWHANLSEEQIGTTLLGLCRDRVSRAALSGRGRKLIDGKGASRVVEYLRNSV